MTGEAPPAGTAARPRFQVLGPLRVAGPVPVDLGGPRQRTVLAVLLTRLNRPVTVEQLIDALWEGSPPDTAKRQIQNYVSALRRTLIEVAATGIAIASEDGCYELRMDPSGLDAEVFAERVVDAERLVAADRPEAAVTALRAALALWRGPALLGLSGRTVEAAAVSLNERRLAAVELCFDLELQLGRHDEIAAELAELVAANPLRERLVGQLMLALYRAGRQADALAQYQHLRKQLAEELGVDPGAALQRLHRAILANEPVDEPVGDASPARRAPVDVPPAQLPPDVAGFAGRDAQLAALDASAGGGPSVMIVAVTGPGGIGKTALAVHWGHRVADRFPDGQLFVNLGGYGTDATMAPRRALLHLIQAFGIAAEQVPGDLQAAAALYRSLLNGRRVLVVLDNADDLDQVLPLLPGAAGCMVVVTSRDRLDGLATAFAAQLMTLDVVNGEEAREIIGYRVGADRMGAEPAAVDQIVRRCAGLPLALAVVAARAAAHTGFSLAAIAAELDTARATLDVFDGGAPAADLRAVFSWSYQRLSTPAAHLFRLLGLHPGPDVEAHAAAAVAGSTPEEARRILIELARNHLVGEYIPGRFIQHDLLREYSGELARALDPERECQVAIRRLLDHYVQSAFAAGSLIDPRRRRPPRELADVAWSGRSFETPEQALAWFAAERPVLLAAAALASRSGLDQHAWRLAWALGPYLDREARWSELIALSEPLADKVDDDIWGRASIHSILGMAYTGAGRLDDADRCHREAVRLFGEAGDRGAQAAALINAGGAFQAKGRFADALERVEAGLEIFRELDDRRGIGMALNAVAYLRNALGEPELGLAYCDEALTYRGDLGPPPVSAILLNRGKSEQRLGRFTEAVRSCEEALATIRVVGYPAYEMSILTQLGDVHHEAGDPAAARVAWLEALAIAEGLPGVDTAPLQTKLSEVDSLL
jgi:DNA-binding SARP family transcriptional activator